MRNIVIATIALSLAVATGRSQNRIRGSQRHQRQILDPCVPFTDTLSLALHHDPLPLARHRWIQEAAPKEDEARSAFVQECVTFLFSSDFVEDGIISQIEFVDMLLHQCRLDHSCNGEFKLNFGQLSVDLRLKFIRGICRSEEYPDRFDCIYNLYEMMRDENLFGFRTNATDVGVLVHDMCYMTYPDAAEMGFVKTRGTPIKPELVLLRGNDCQTYALLLPICSSMKHQQVLSHPRA